MAHAMVLLVGSIVLSTCSCGGIVSSTAPTDSGSGAQVGDDWCAGQDDGAYCQVCDLGGACDGGFCQQVQPGPPHCDAGDPCDDGNDCTEDVTLGDHTCAHYPFANLQACGSNGEGHCNATTETPSCCMGCLYVDGDVAACASVCPDGQACGANGFCP